ncbi:MAG: N-6 DNA methylase [Chitinivibrionia bacterium]|nr:N-6 DNA methylase [Chitinivibrionia bacterium]
MSEELLQRDLINHPEKIGKWDFYNIGATTVKALKEYGIIHNFNYGNEEKKKVDALLAQKKNVVAVIEYKKPAEFKTAEQKNKAIKQELEVARKLKAKIFIATDTKETVWINVATGNEIKDENNKKLKTNFDIKNEKLPDLLEKIIVSINEKNDQIKPKELVNPTDLAKQIWQDIWSVSGDSPTNCLYSFVELFIFKYLSDLGVLGQGINFDHLMERFFYDIENPDEEALEYYAKNIRPKIKDLFPKSLIDNTTIINGTVFINKDQQAVKGYSTVFKKALIRFKNYGKLENIDYDFKSHLFESFLKEGISKKNLGQYFTPLKVVRAIVEMAKDDIKDGINICDPACGVGKFLLEPLTSRLDYFYDISKKGIIPKITIHGFDKGFDNEEQKTIILAKANMLIYFSDLIKENVGLTKEFAKLFNNSFTLKTNSILGTLSDPAIDKYDLILTNPPYVTSGSSNLKEEIKKDGELVNYYKINAMGVEGLFMEWIIRALKPNGKAFIVVPDGIFNRQNDKNLRQFILNECFIDCAISLPEKTFFTTPKKTYILGITKKTDKKELQNMPVFTYLVSEIGESRDIYRFNIEQDDLSEAVISFLQFKGAKQHYKTDDKRCKIQSISKFQPENNWSVERWWSKEEKIELGIVEENNAIKFDEVPDLLDEMSNNLLSFKEEILQINEKKKTNLNVKHIPIYTLFEILGEADITKAYIQKNIGNYPVYSGQTENNGLFGHINTFKYDYPIITWATYGVHAGTLFKRYGQYNIGRNACGLKLREEFEGKILLDYIVYIAESIFKENAKGDKGGYRSLPQNLVKNIQIPIPFDEQGNIDIEKQKEVIGKYEYIAELKTRIENYKKRIEELRVEVENECSKKIFKLDNLFEIKSGNSKLTQNYLNNHKGEYVVYSANTKQNGVFGYINSYDFDLECLQMTTNGNAGVLFYRQKHKFSINGDARVLIRKYDTLDYIYLLYTIQNEFDKQNFNWGNKATIEKIKPIEIPIPINAKEEFDISAQQQIAEKYRKIEQIKKSILEELDKITNIEIDLE